MQQRIRFFVSVSLLIFNFSSSLASSVDPKIKWQVLETDHFKVIFDSNLNEVARLFAWHAERAHFFLQPIFKEYPAKTHILINDSTDFANGFAGFFPFPMITVFPVLPDDLDSIGYYDNWASELMIHEYTHILSFEPSNGFYRPFKYVFGSIIHPTAILPSWWLEGLAVEMETRFTQHGRLRSPQYGASLRNLVLSDQLNFESIDRINASDIPSWPFGQRPYLFGSLVWNKIIQESGVEVPSALLQRYSQRVPFLLNSPLQDQTKKTYQEILSELYQGIEQKVANETSKISKGPLAKEVPFHHAGSGQHSPVISPNQKYLAYLAFVPKQSGQIRLIERNPGAKESFSTKPFQLLLKSAGTSRISWLPDSSGIIYDQSKIYKRHYRYRDLYHYDLASKKSRRLTQGLRASEPEVSPNGQQVVFVQSGAATSQISILNLADSKVKTLFKPKRILSRVSRPQFLGPNEIIFGVHNSNGETGLMALKLNDSEPRTVLKNFMPVRQPRSTKKGLLVVSDRSGVSNLYLANSNLTDAKPLTNSKTEVLNGEFDPVTNELIYSQLAKEGPKLFGTPFLASNSIPKIEPLITQHWKSPPEGPKLKDVKMSESEFSSWPYLYPRYWIPFLYPVEGGVLIQGSTSAGDPLGKHSYGLDASYDSVTRKPSYGFSYLNRTLPIDWTLSYAESQQYLSGYDLTLTNRSAGTNASFYLPFLSDRFRGGLGYSHIETSGPNAHLKREGPSTFLSYSTFSPSAEETNEPSPEDLAGNYNTQISLAHTEYLERSNYIDYGRSSFSWNQVISKSLPPNHSFVTQLRGAFAPDMPWNLVVPLGDKTVGANYIASLVTSSFLMRGYPSTTFVGRKILNGNLEYRFPLADIYRGKGLFPLFFKDLNAALFVDAVSVDGGAFDQDAGGYVQSGLGKPFWGAGGELKISTTVAYQLPLTFILGGYYGFDREKLGGFQAFFGIGIEGISDINQMPKSSEISR